MTAAKKSFWNKYIQPNLTLGVIIMIVGGGITYYLDREKKDIQQEVKDASIESRIPEDVKTFVEWEKHMNEKPSDVETDRMHRRNLEVGDSLLILSKKQEAQQIILTEQLKILDTFRIYIKAQDIKDSIVEVKKQVSRDSRTKDMEIQKATTLLILDELRKINKDTIN